MGLIDNAKDAAKLVQQIGNIELYEKLVSLQQDMMGLIDENRDLKDKVRTLEQQLEALKKQADVSADMEYVEDGGFFIRKSEKAAGRNIPYCPLCWTASNHAVVNLHPNAEHDCYTCDIHKSFYKTVAYRERERNAAPRYLARARRR
jgi:hypothetical protein